MVAIRPYAVVMLGSLAVGCTGDPIAAEWSIGFADPEQEGRASVVVARILEGGCDGTSERWRVELTEDGDSLRPPALSPGTYGFAAEARDAPCRTFAMACTEVTLPLQGTDAVELALAPVPEVLACESACDRGHCVATEPDPQVMFYVSPDGDDGAAGTREAPWRTPAHAVAQLAPGHTLVFLDGEYAFDTTGGLDIDCAGDAVHGTAADPIRVIAQTERRAFLRGGGDAPPVRVRNCSYWHIEGLRAESRDREGLSGDDDIVSVVDSSHIVLRRLLLSRTNRMLNSRALFLYRTADSLVEETEVYDFHDTGLSLHSSERIRVRRCFVGSRDYPYVTAGDPLYPSGTATVDGAPPSDGGHGGMHLSETDDCLVENVVTERGIGFISYTFSSSSNNAIVGSAALEPAYGFLAGHSDEAGVEARGLRLENVVSIRGTYSAFFLRGQDDARVTNGSAIEASHAGYSFDDPYPDSPSASTYCTNCLSTRNESTGFSVQEQVDWEVRSSTTFGDGREYLDDSNVVDPVNVDPELGGCLVYLPEGSPLRGAGADGADIGANVLYRYRDGGETDVPLWDHDGRFPCFGVVEGVNDDPSTSCTGIHERLHVGTADCPLPPALRDR